MSPRGSGRQDSPGMVVRPSTFTCVWVGLCACVYGHVHWYACKWKSEDNLLGISSTLPPCGLQETEFRLSALVATAVTQRQIFKYLSRLLRTSQKPDLSKSQQFYKISEVSQPLQITYAQQMWICILTRVSIYCFLV